MMRRLRPGGVPLHPALVHFPVAFWTAALALDGAALATGRPEFWQGARLALAAGSLTGLAALAAGMLEYLALARTEHAARIERHALLAGIAWAIFTFGWLWREVGAIVPGNASWLAPGYTGCSAVGFIFLLVAGHAGARLVYGHGVGRVGDTE